MDLATVCYLSPSTVNDNFDRGVVRAFRAGGVVLGLQLSSLLVLQQFYF